MAESFHVPRTEAGTYLVVGSALPLSDGPSWRSGGRCACGSDRDEMWAAGLQRRHGEFAQAPASGHGCVGTCALEEATPHRMLKTSPDPPPARAWAGGVIWRQLVLRAGGQPSAWESRRDMDWRSEETARTQRQGPRRPPARCGGLAWIGPPNTPPSTRELPPPPHLARGTNAENVQNFCSRCRNMP